MKRKQKPKSPPTEPVSVEAMSNEEFFEWLKDPENRKAYREEAERAVRGDYPELPPEARAAARVCLEKLDEQEHLEVVDAKMKQLIKMFKTPGGSLRAEEQVEQCRRLFDELTDELLETPEPHRSRFLKAIVPMREMVQAIKLDPDGEQTGQPP